LGSVAEKANPLARIHHGTDIKEGITTNLGSNIDRNPFVCEVAGANQTPNVFSTLFFDQGIRGYRGTGTKLSGEGTGSEGIIVDGG
jgi:hypothetical protein